MPRLALLAPLAVLALAPAAQAGVIHSGTITVNRGFNGATLGMTRAAVVDHLGKPVEENANRVMDYTNILHSRDILEVFRGPKNRVVNFQLDSSGKRFRLADGNAVYAKGGLRRLFDHYGSRLHRNKVYQGQKSYSLFGRKYLGRRVETTFLVSKFARSGNVYEIDIFFRR